MISFFYSFVMPPKPIPFASEMFDVIKVELREASSNVRELNDEIDSFDGSVIGWVVYVVAVCAFVATFAVVVVALVVIVVAVAFATVAA